MTIEKLKRVRAGSYETRDGRYRITREPLAGGVGPAFQMGVQAAWWVHDLTDDPDGAGDAINVNDPCGTLWEAKAWLERERSC